MIKVVLVFIILSVSLSVLAHEFWLQPTRFRYNKGETAVINFRVGENFEGENWSGSRSKVNTLELFQFGKVTDISSLLGDAKGDSLLLTGLNEGTALIAYNGLNSFIELEATKFNAYLEEDNLKTAMEYRKAHHQTDSMGREFYQRSVKTIIQVGANYTTDYAEPTKLPLDIIPLQHPYRINDSAEISFRILFRGKPLANQLCKVWHSDKGKTTMKELKSSKSGLINTKVTATGRWMISTVNMVPSELAGAQWQSFWGSVTWGYY